MDLLLCKDGFAQLLFALSLGPIFRKFRILLVRVVFTAGDGGAFAQNRHQPRQGLSGRLFIRLKFPLAAFGQIFQQVVLIFFRSVIGYNIKRIALLQTLFVANDDCPPLLITRNCRDQAGNGFVQCLSFRIPWAECNVFVCQKRAQKRAVFLNAVKVFLFCDYNSVQSESTSIPA
ncbi:MAG: hypothetical protein II458_00410 [Oscillospiraceae bacterium]|nr:hypothetical protein [Oscillospiraceae bacterium]